MTIMSRSRNGARVVLALALLLGGCAYFRGDPGENARKTQIAGEARPPGAGGALTRFVGAAENRDAVLSVARQHEAALPDACPSAAFQKVGVLTLYRPVRFDAQGRPTEGAWRESVEATGCGTRRTFNVLTIIAADEPVRRVPLLPGGTIADPVLQQDALPDAVRGAAAANPGCRDGIVVDTRFDEFEGASAASRPWRETWTVAGCGRLVDVPITFAPDARGTGIRTDPRAARLRT
jgi:hypothetical protein